MDLIKDSERGKGRGTEKWQKRMKGRKERRRQGKE